MEISTSRWLIKTKTSRCRCKISTSSSRWWLCSSPCKAVSHHSSRCSTIKIIRWRNNSNLWTKVMPGTGSQVCYRRVNRLWCSSSSKCLKASTWSTSKWLTWEWDRVRRLMIRIWWCSNRWWLHPIRASNKMSVEVRAARQQWWNNSQHSRCSNSSNNSNSNKRLLKLKRKQAVDSTCKPQHSIFRLKSSFLSVPLLKRMNSSLDSASLMKNQKRKIRRIKRQVKQLHRCRSRRRMTRLRGRASTVHSSLWSKQRDQRPIRWILIT